MARGRRQPDTGRGGISGTRAGPASPEPPTRHAVPERPTDTGELGFSWPLIEDDVSASISVDNTDPVQEDEVIVPEPDIDLTADEATGFFSDNQIVVRWLSTPIRIEGPNLKLKNQLAALTAFLQLSGTATTRYRTGRSGPLVPGWFIWRAGPG